MILDNKMVLVNDDDDYGVKWANWTWQMIQKLLIFLHTARREVQCNHDA